MPHVHSPKKTPDPGKAPPRPGPETEPRIVALRHATAEDHAAVEGLPVMAALMAPTVTWEDYRRYLERMARVYGTLEPPLLACREAALGPHPDLMPAGRPKLPALLRDLSVLGIPAPRIAARPDPGGLSETLGGLYVLEGAALGSRVIARHRRRHQQDGTGDLLGSAAFMGLHDDAQGPAVSLAWRQFGDSLDALAERDLIARGRVVAGARAAFAWVYRILAGPPSPP